MKLRMIRGAALWVFWEILITFFCIGPVTTSIAQEYKIVFQDIDWSPSDDFIAFTAIKVKSDWSDYSADKWQLFTYDLKTRKIKSICSKCVYFSISSNGEQIAYDKVLDRGKDIYKVDLKSGITEPVIENPGKDAGPSWSTDNQHLVFYSDKDGNEELFTVNLITGERKQLTHRKDQKSYNPVWSPVSDQIVYFLEKGDNKDQIYLTDKNGLLNNNLTDDDHHNVFPSWSPDGKIIYVRDKGEVMIMNADGTQKETLLEKSGGLAAMSPEGTRLLFVSEDRAGLSILDMKTKIIERLITSADLDIN